MIISIRAMIKEIRGYKKLKAKDNLLIDNLVAPNIRKVENIRLFLEKIYMVVIIEIKSAKINKTIRREYIEKALKNGIFSFNKISYFHIKAKIEVIVINCDISTKIILEKTIFPLIILNAYPIIELYTTTPIKVNNDNLKTINITI